MVACMRELLKEDQTRTTILSHHAGSVASHIISLALTLMQLAVYTKMP